MTNSKEVNKVAHIYVAADPFTSIEGIFLGVGELFIISLAAPIAIAMTLWLRGHRGYIGIRTARISLLTLGIYMIFRSVYIALRYTGVHSVLDIQIKGGIGLVIAGLACAFIEHFHLSKDEKHGKDQRDLRS
ncbi:hypothetical protein ABZ912_40675 [Nonomuraea angiospora]|uniref:hypothetical protein n=1 Tax=Nonomuraea angiospora TaxID=46172 RepID=UPI00340DAE20